MSIHLEYTLNPRQTFSIQLNLTRNLVTICVHSHIWQPQDHLLRPELRRSRYPTQNEKAKPTHTVLEKYILFFSH